MIDRILERVRIRAETDDDRLDRRLRAARVGLMVAVAVEQWNLLPAWRAESESAIHLALTLIASVAAPLGASTRFGRGACALVCGAAGIDLVLAFPRHANHHHLIFLCTLILAGAASDRSEEKRLALAGLRWLLIIAVFWSGLQKALYGYHFGGELLAMLIAEEPRFALLFGAILPGSEVARLTALVPNEGAGPYRVDSWVFLAAANLSLFAEIVLPIALLRDRTRPFALGALLLLFVAIEAAAREVFFGLMVVQLSLLFAERDWIVRLLPITLSAYALLLVAGFGWLGSWFFT